jgi:dipeptidyl-peptidase 4
VTTAGLPAQIVRTQRFTLGVPRQFTVAMDGTVVLFLRSRAGDDPVTCLWALDLCSGTERLLAGGTGIASYAADDGARLAAFTLAGGLWAVDTATGEARSLPAASPAADPRPDPSGRWIAYAHGGALRVIAADGTGDRPVAAPDRPDVVFGIGEEAGIVALQGTRGYWWAPRGDRLLVARVDSSAVGRTYLADPAEPRRPPRCVRYPAAGQANAEVTLWIAGQDGSLIEVCWDDNAVEYVPRAGWDAHGPYAVVQSRDQRMVRFLGIDPASGQTTVLAKQHDERWVQLVPGLPARSGSGALIGHDDLLGTRHLTVDGTPVTPPGLQLRAVLSVDGDGVLFTASGNPAETHLWSYQPADGLRRLSHEPGAHTGVRRGGVLVHVARCANADRPGGRFTVFRESKPPLRITSLAERPVLGLRRAILALGPRALPAALYLPSWHRPGSGLLPVLVDPYGGASMQRVTAELDWQCLVSQWFAEQGFAVLVADGRGTPGRGPEWERAVHGDPFGPVLDDQVTALHEAARLQPDLDLRRVGIRGWSFGGSLAAVAVLRRPDVFHAAVAGAAVTDPRLHNAHWRERFLGHPDEFPERYAECSLVAAARSLARPLLLMHGLADDNVLPANTLRLSAALLAAGRPHEVLLLPGAGHPNMGPGISEQLLWHQLRFLQQHLGITPRQETVTPRQRP